MATRPAPRSTDTRRRLLEAAGEVFAAEGFRSATIQQICRRADANIAAVHYHFGDKERLYAEVIKDAERYAQDHFPPLDVVARTGPPDERLRAHIGSFLARLLDQGRPAWHARLMAREMIDPTTALDRLVRDKIRVNHRHLAALVRELMGADASAATVRMCVLSIVGQCLFYRHSAPVIERLYPDLVPPHEVPRIAAHITRFSLGAICSLRSAPRGRRSRQA